MAPPSRLRSATVADEVLFGLGVIEESESVDNTLALTMPLSPTFRPSFPAVLGEPGATVETLPILLIRWMPRALTSTPYALP